jgi:hypothetical protein
MSVCFFYVGVYSVAATPKKKVARKATKKPAKTAKKKRSTRAVKKKPASKPETLLVSVFTPTDGIQHLQECYASLCGQMYTHWEWILVPNGALDTVTSIPLNIRKDPRVKVQYFPIADEGAGVNIGALKKFAVYQCSGQLYVELDHDDILSNDALFEIVSAYKKTGAGFLYSNFASFREDGSSITYPESTGWDSYPVQINGKKFLASRAFAPTADSVHRIHTTANHIRVWSKEAYEQVGGHDPELRVCDDYDLISRTYLDKILFHHIDKCLYLYRQWDGSRSVVEMNAEIQALEGTLAHQRTHAIVKEDCRRRDLFSIVASTTGEEGTILYSDISNLDDNSVGWVFAKDVLQHLTGEDAFSWLNMIWEKLAPGGWVSLAVPSTDGRGAFQIPTNKSFWNANSFSYFLNSNSAAQIGITEYTAHFHSARRWDEHPDSAHAAASMLYSNTDLIAIKDKRRIAGSQLLR